MPGWSDLVRGAIDRTVREQAQRNELLIARVRMICLLVAVAFQWPSTLHAFPALGFPERTPLALAIGASGWLLAAAVLVRALGRGWYARWLSLVLPLADAMLLVGSHLLLTETLGRSSVVALLMIHMSFVLTCALLALTGALRLTARASMGATAIAMAALVVGLVLGGYRSVGALGYLVGLLAVVGLMSWWLAAIVGRAVQSEVGKVMLRRFLPAGVVDRAHDDPLPLLDEPRAVTATILVSDLRGFTSLSERVSPTELLTLLSELQGAFAQVVVDCGGTVDKFMGDGMLAVFGAPAALPDHASRGVEAARGLLVALARVNAARVARAQAPVAMGIGVHTGPVIAGCLGGADRVEFTVLGDAVNAASRLESLTKERGVEVLVSGDCVRAAGHAHALTALGEVTLRGRATPLDVYTLSTTA
ncbi:MAG: adenylate/guanylate cyclase domain-containing protein [Kofleriaceae bacterium]